MSPKKRESNVAYTRRLFHRGTLPAEHEGRGAEERRIREELDDQRIHLRWNPYSREWVVFYDAKSGMYVAATFPPCPSIGARVIHTLKRRQRNRRQLQEWYEQQLKAGREETNRRIDDTAETLADGLHSHAVGKVTTCMT